MPVVGDDGHLPAVHEAHLSVDAIRRRFALVAAGFQPEFTGDGLRFGAPSAPAHASVLVPLVPRPEGLHVLLTRRTEHLRDHAGQISFPGGRRDPGDLDAAATALREAHEEVGLPPEAVQVIGQLPVYTTVTRFEVTPVVGLVSPHAPRVLDPFEVAEAFEVPLKFLMTPAHHRRHRAEIDGQAREFLSMPWVDDRPGGTGREYFIWGATAAMLRNLYRFLHG